MEKLGISILQRHFTQTIFPLAQTIFLLAQTYFPSISDNFSVKSDFFSVTDKFSVTSDNFSVIPDILICKCSYKFCQLRNYLLFMEKNMKNHLRLKGFSK